MYSNSAIVSLAIWVGILIAGVVFAAEEATVTATVTAENLSVHVDDGSVAYGTLALSASANTVGTDTQFASNSGNVTEDINIRGTNTVAWTLASAIASNVYTHEFSTNAGALYLFMSTSQQEFADAVAANSSQQFDLRITVPSSTSSGAQQSADVTVTAVAED